MKTETTLEENSDCLGFDMVMVGNWLKPCVLFAERGIAADSIRKPFNTRDILPAISCGNWARGASV